MLPRPATNSRHVLRASTVVLAIAVSGCSAGPTDKTTGSAGDSASTNTSASTSTSTVSTPTMPATGPTGRELFFDDFSYTVDRDDIGTNTDNGFVNNGPWTWVKALNVNETGARAYLYTTDSILGYEDVMPSASGRVLCFEQKSGTLLNQTDAYLQLGGAYPEYPHTTIPGDVWIQHWVYLQNYGAEAGYTKGAKWFYFTRNA